MTPELWRGGRIETVKPVIMERFAGSFGSLRNVETRLAAALSDLLARPGSMVRATTSYLLGIDLGVPEEAAMSVSCGIEYLHTASLVFDDLPAMDDARMRRGSACLHVVHGEATAMLAALALINRGYAMLWQGIRHAPPSRRAEASHWVDSRLGIHGVIGGQAYDLSGWDGEQSSPGVSEVAARKTGDLLRLALVLPALIGCGTRREIRLLDKIGLMRGLAYQAVDDLKDMICPEEWSGKTSGRDRELGRPNLIMAEGFQSALRRFKRLRQIGDRLQASLPGPPERWEMLAPLRVTLPISPDFVLPSAVAMAS